MSKLTRPAARGGIALLLVAYSEATDANLCTCCAQSKWTYNGCRFLEVKWGHSGVVSFTQKNPRKMENTDVKKTLAAWLLCLMVLATTVSTVAADRSNLILTRRGVIVKQPSTVTTPGVQHDASLKTIAGNLSDYPYGVFFCCYGDYITGLTNLLNVVPEYWQAVPFTPAADMTVKEVEASVLWDEGTNTVILSLNRDSGGLPGKAIHTWNVKNLAIIGSCCQLATGKSAAGIAVKKGTQYWVVVSTNSNDSNIFAAWEVNSTDMRLHPFASYCDDSRQGKCNGNSGKWAAASGLLPGYAVLGQ